MPQKFLRYLIFSSILFTTTSTHASFGKEPNKMITFQGQEKYLMNLIIASYFNHEHPFSVTQIIRKDHHGSHHCGDILNLEQQDFNNIYHKNYVYLNYHTQLPTRLIRDEAVPVSLLILGTTDRQSCLKLKFKYGIKPEGSRDYVNFSLTIDKKNTEQNFKKIEKHRSYGKPGNRME